ncbi:MAG: carboxymuconolactone decarboxylase family protein [Myxococcota bacterium]|jgi:alkyl hydroperoxide reductase subunit D
MDRINALREQLPDAARDIKINLQNVLGQTELSKAQAWGTALACAYATRDKALWTAVLEDAKAAGLEEGTLDDAKAAAILMGMNNVYYRFRHIIGKEEYSQMPARLRMLRTNQVAGNKQDFELFCMAVSAIGNCQSCVQSHERAVLESGLSVAQVHDAVRIAATINAAAVALATL